MVEFNKNNADFFKKNGLKFNVEKQGNDVLTRKEVAKITDILGSKNDQKINKMASFLPQVENQNDDNEDILG